MKRTSTEKSQGKRKKAKTKSACKSYNDKVVFAIRALKASGGSSRQAIAKFLKNEFDSDNLSALRKALKKGEESGLLSRDKQSFRVAEDPEYEPEKGSTVEIVDTKIGTGEEADLGCSVRVSYKETLADTGEQFDQAKSFSFVLGAGDVIKGWDQGVAGMKVGGKRTLTVPPKLGYGKKGSGKKGEAGSIPGDATLVFEITLKAIV